MPSYLISLLEVKLIKLPTYESAAELDRELSVAMLSGQFSRTRNAFVYYMYRRLYMGIYGDFCELICVSLYCFDSNRVCRVSNLGVFYERGNYVLSIYIVGFWAFWSFHIISYK